jgi:mannose-1-phosphate guanylyltransferase
MYAVILAGGGGTRLWPLSRPERPKPFLPLLGDETLLQRTVDRILPLDQIAREVLMTQQKF